jgi:hypothetical protein
MASREELQLLRGARAGQATAQLALGKLYLFGSKSLPQSVPTALHWLDRAARQECEEAWMLIGNNVPFEMAVQFNDRASICRWFERAFDAGSLQAGLVFAKLALQYSDMVNADQRDKAIGALEAAAQAGLPDAQWLLAEHGADESLLNAPARDKTRAWTERAADNGVLQAQSALAEQAWESGNRETFLRWALPLARAIAQRPGKQAKTDSEDDSSRRLNSQDARLLSRCAQMLSATPEFDADEVQSFWTLAAQHGDESATIHLGLWFARMDENGARDASRSGTANFKKAIRWLAQAGEQGSADALYALSRIYLKPEFSQRSLADALRYLEQAADMGHMAAQLECGTNAWRARRENEANDVRAVYWLQKAAAQGSSEAALLLDKIATRAAPALWALAAQRQLTRDTINSQPFLAARIELAALFGLTRPEALLLDLSTADQDHCLLIDIRAHYSRSRRRLVLLQTGQERQALSRIVRLFEKVDCGMNGPEGNYRQRQYRLKTLLPDAYLE